MHGGWTRRSRRRRGSEDNILLRNKLRIGIGARYANVYPLFHTGG